MMTPVNAPSTLIARFRRINPHARLPEYATPHSACFDVSACLPLGATVTSYSPKNVTRTDTVTHPQFILHPATRYLIPTGWAVACPSGYSLRLYSRSGLSLKLGLLLVNGVGVVDADYRQEVCVLLMNTSHCATHIEHGMRLCQGEFVQQPAVCLSPIEATDEEWFTTARTGGFGSTGV